MDTEVTVVMRFRGSAPPELLETLEEEFDCDVVEYEEEAV